MKITINANLVRAAQATQGEYDSRPYLNGFLLTPAGEIVGSDGSMLFKARYVVDGSDTVLEDTIINIHGKIPKWTKTVTFILYCDEKVGTLQGQGTCIMDSNKVFDFDIVDGTYPDWKSILPQHDRWAFCNGCMMDPKLLAAIQKCFGKNSVKLLLGKEGEVLLITASKSRHYDCCYDEAVLAIMPLKSEKPDTFFRSGY